MGFISDNISLGVSRNSIRIYHIRVYIQSIKMFKHRENDGEQHESMHFRVPTFGQTQVFLWISWRLLIEIAQLMTRSGCFVEVMGVHLVFIHVNQIWPSGND